MDDRSTDTAFLFAINPRNWALACAILAIGVKAACGQTMLRMLGEPGHGSPAHVESSLTTIALHDAANIVESSGDPLDLFDYLSAASADRTEQHHAQSFSPTTIRFADSALAETTPVDSDLHAVNVPEPFDVEIYRIAGAIRFSDSQTSPAVPEPTLSEQFAPRPVPLVRTERPPIPAPAPRQVTLDRSRLPSIAQPNDSPNAPTPAPDAVAALPRRIEFEPVDTPTAPAPSAAPSIASQYAIEDSPSRLAMPLVVSSQPVAAPEQVPSGPSYLSDAISAGAAPYCDGDVQFSEACPYYPWQSGTRAICGVDCGPYGAPCCEKWKDARWIPWSLLGPGEYVGPPRPEHVPVYYLRVNDMLTLTYIVSGQKQPDRYRIGVGDKLRIESSFDETLDRELLVQPDGEITLPLVGDVPAAGKTVKELRDDLTRIFGRIERDPVITVTPLVVNTALQEILNAVTTQSRLSGQAIDLRVTPEGTIQAPGLGSVFVQGLTIEELRSELVARYTAAFGPGLLVSPALSERATSYVFLGGEVVSPGRYSLEGPTTVMQAIALAGGWRNGGNTREVVVFRRDENWCLKATKINVHRPLYGKDPCPVNDVWLRDNDLVIVPKTKILCAADVIELYFTRGVYAVFPITFVKDFSTGSTMAVPVGP